MTGFIDTDAATEDAADEEQEDAEDPEGDETDDSEDEEEVEEGYGVEKVADKPPSTFHDTITYRKRKGIFTMPGPATASHHSNIVSKRHCGSARRIVFAGISTGTSTGTSTVTSSGTSTGTSTPSRLQVIGNKRNAELTPSSTPGSSKQQETNPRTRKASGVPENLIEIERRRLAIEEETLEVLKRIASALEKK